MDTPGTVLVTGASGYIALHTIKRLLDSGHRVRGTLRTPDRGDSLKAALKRHDCNPQALEFIAADLSRDAGWAQACEGCSHVLHMASPFPMQQPEHENELIIPAREGALRVLKAASQAGVHRVVMTSSVAAITAGLPRTGGRVFNAEDWSDINSDIGAYPKSKTLAERAAWEYVDGLSKEERLELVVINPGIVFGPILKQDAGTSVEVILRLMKAAVPGCPKLGWAMVDVRDVADAHIAAMTAPDAPGHRYPCAIEHVWMQEIAAILKAEFGPRGYRIPGRRLPSWLLRVIALFDPSVRLVLPDLDRRQDIDNSAIRRDLAWQPRPRKETIIDTGTSLIAEGLV